MLHLLAEWLLYSVGLIIATNVIPGFKIKNFGTALLAALVVGLVNVSIGWLLTFLAFPINFLTFGLFAALIALLINACVLKIASVFAPGFKVQGFLPAFLAALLLAVLQFVWRVLARA